MNKTIMIDAINRALHDAMKKDPKTLFFGLGATDPKRIFGSAKGLVEVFGSERVFDMPTSENGMTGIAVGAAIMGYRPIMVHQRLDFFLLAMDQLINSAAKWQYMFGGQDSVPLTIRLIMGRGWGQGPTHSQNLQSWFAHIPGLKVVMPATVVDAYGLLYSSIFDANPVVFMEHRWLHSQEGQLASTPELIPLGKASIMRAGSDVTLVGMSYMSLEAVRAAEFLKTLGVSVEVVDLRTIMPMDFSTIEASVKKTGRLIALDTASNMFSVASEIVAHCSEKLFNSLKSAPQKLGSPHVPVPTSVALSKQFYPGAAQIVSAVLKSVGVNKQPDMSCFHSEKHDVPGAWFTGPF